MLRKKTKGKHLVKNIRTLIHGNQEFVASLLWYKQHNGQARFYDNQFRLHKLLAQDLIILARSIKPKFNSGNFNGEKIPLQPDSLEKLSIKEPVYIMQVLNKDLILDYKRFMVNHKIPDIMEFKLLNISNCSRKCIRVSGI
ncbi:MAG TPA: hypothetical protein ENH91_07765 [Leeuwenhoekiella sp.]|nr:hypothetical protein [Leeuwenhoekiella sp.]